MQDLHKFLSGDRLFLDQESGNVIQNAAVCRKHVFCFLICLFEHGSDFFIDLGLCHLTAVQNRLIIEVLVCRTLQTGQTEFLRHTVACDH